MKIKIQSCGDAQQSLSQQFFQGIRGGFKGFILLSAAVPLESFAGEERDEGAPPPHRRVQSLEVVLPLIQRAGQLRGSWRGDLISISNK